MSENFRGAFLMVASMAAFVFNDTAVKLRGERLPLFQIMFLRGILTVMFVAGLCHYFRVWTLRCRGRIGQLWRYVHLQV